MYKPGVSPFSIILARSQSASDGGDADYASVTRMQCPCGYTYPPNGYTDTSHADRQPPGFSKLCCQRKRRKR
jgi:hypothetical protein